MRVLVTGGGGFLGRAVVRQLLDRGDDVTIAARSDYPDVQGWGAEQVRGDLAEPAVADAACEGQDAVMHVAAKAGYWGDLAEYHRCNVTATQNVVDACRKHGVQRLVYTSSPSVTFRGNSHEHAGNDLPYSDTFSSPYPQTKAEAERLVLAAQGPDLSTVALRPHLIWGPGDPYVFPQVIRRHMQGKMPKVDASNKVDITYVDNAAVAHLQALDTLAPGAPHAGKAYFISDGEPVELWPFLDRIFEALDLPPLKRSVPKGMLFAIGSTIEGTHKLLGLKSEPRLTKFLVEQITTSHYYDMGPAERDFGYRPVVDRATAWDLTIADMRARGLCG